MKQETVTEFADRCRECGSMLGRQMKQKNGNNWIPVSERLPEEDEHCLCCDKDGYMTLGHIPSWSKSKTWCFDDDEVDIDVIAWMPLPEPYRETIKESEEINGI